MYFIISSSPHLTMHSNSIPYLMPYSNCNIFLFPSRLQFVHFSFKNFSSKQHFFFTCSLYTRYCRKQQKLFHNTCQELRKWSPGFLPFYGLFFRNTHTKPNKLIPNNTILDQIHRKTDGFFLFWLPSTDSSVSSTM